MCENSFQLTRKISSLQNADDGSNFLILQGLLTHLINLKLCRNSKKFGFHRPSNLSLTRNRRMNHQLIGADD